MAKIWLIILRGFGLIILFLCANCSEHDKIIGGDGGLRGAARGGASGGSGLGGGKAVEGGGFRRVKAEREFSSSYNKVMRLVKTAFGIVKARWQLLAVKWK